MMRVGALGGMEFIRGGGAASNFSTRAAQRGDGDFLVRGSIVTSPRATAPRPSCSRLNARGIARFSWCVMLLVSYEVKSTAFCSIKSCRYARKGTCGIGQF